MDKLLKTVILMSFIMGLALPLSYAYDIDPHYKFSGVKSPDSPYRNTWGAFQTDLFSGSFSYEYKIDVPPGTNGLTPKITIGYNSHSAKGKAGWVGAGWDIPATYIQRNIQYTRTDTADDTFELYLDGAKHDLVYVASEGRWHTKTESYLRIEKKSGGQNERSTYWVVTTKDGTEYRFGFNQDSENLLRVSDSAFKSPWSDEGIGWYAYTLQPSGTLPVYRFWNAKIGDHFYTANEAEKQSLMSNSDWTYEGIAWYAYSAQQVGTGPVYRFYNSKAGDHFYTANEAEKQSLMSNSDWTYEGIAWYAYPSQQVGTVPIYRLCHSQYQDHFFTSSEEERSSIVQLYPYVWRWSLDRIHDPNDNCICFNYVEDQGAVYLDNIKYNSCNNDGNRVIQFIRESKPDAYLMIDQGSEVYDAYRLKEIRISLDNTVVRTYGLAYPLYQEGNPYKSLLASITQYGTDITKSLPPVKFDYVISDNGFKDSINWDTPGTGRMDIRTFDKDHNDTDGDIFDVNGDGLPDIVRFDETQAVHDNWDVWLNTGSGFSGNKLTWSVPKGWAIRNSDMCTSSQSPNTKTAPMDINRDGYIDFLKADGDGSNLEFRINDGNNFTSTTDSWSLPINAYIRDVRNPYDGDAPNVEQTFFDMNGDGLPDIVKKEKVDSSWYWHIWRNAGKGFVDFGLWQVHQSVGNIEDFTRGDTTNTEVSHYDVNGDGLTDIVVAYDYIWRIWLNTGSNFIDGGPWDTHNTSFDNLNDTNDDGKVKRDFIDINGDGLPDIVNPVANVRDWEVWYNTGKGFTNKQAWYVPDDVDQNGYLTNLDDAGDTSRDVFDIDGDGAVDIIREFDGYWKIYPNKAGQAELLSKITDTLGGTVSITYESSAQYSNTRLPFNYWVVDSVETNNGMAGSHSLISTTDYSYAQGLYDFPTREFRGFGQVTETRADSSKVIHYYHQDEAKKGKEHITETKNSSDAPFASVQNIFSEALSNGIYTSNITQTDESTFDGIPDNRKLKRKEYQNYDSFGNVGLLVDYGDWNSGGDEVYTYNEYWPSCSSAYIVDKLRHKYIKPSDAGSTLRESFYWYDNSTSCVSKGNLTKEENWLNTGNNPVTLHEYDTYGNRTKTTETTDSNGHITQQLYDSTYHTFPVQIINAKNQITSRTYNVVNGQPLQETDPNGFTTTFVYDTFQRKIREVKPYDSDASPTTSIQYVMDGIPPESVIVYKKDGTPTFDTVQFVDGFGNLIQTKAEYGSNMNKTVVDVFYDEMGRVKKQSNPYLTDSTLAYSPPDVIAPGTGYTYDPLGRPIEILNPDGTQINRTFDHWNVTETDENGHTKSYAFDASQRLKQVVENNSASSYITNYIYSPLGELNTITDHLGNVTTIAYDSLGRKIQMNDPDMSTWIYAYDKVGNLVSQTDAKGITTNITYDPLNRKTFINYPSSADIQFTYDTGTIGALSQVVDAAGTVNYYYDQRLRKSREDRTIDGNTFSTLWAYDSMDRVTSQTYPDGQSVTFNYNAQGKLDNVPGIISGIDYNASGQVTQKNYANGKNTSYTYDAANQRLNKILTSSIQNLSYTYDNVGNINSLSDGIAGKTESFSYDDLDRLKTAGDSSYAIQYQYNAIGNMTSMTKDGKATTFTYGATNNKPHAVTGMSVSNPVVGSFVINNGDAVTTTNVVTLNNISMGNPTLYMASEHSNFAGAFWQTFSTAPTFLLSAGFGMKTVYFKVMNTEGESNVKNDSIAFRLNPADAYLDDDGDGLTNMMEYLHGTNPNKKDTDGDGINDYAEVFGGKSNPGSPDSDGDGLDDLKDPYATNPYHISFSENYTMRHTLNEGGDYRNSQAYKISDSLGNGFGKEVIPLQSHPDLSATPNPVDFKIVLVGETRSMKLNITNSGIVELVVQSIAFTGQNQNEFTKLNDTCSDQTLIPSVTCTVDIIFAPTSASPKAADLNIQSNAPATPQKNVHLFGAGIDNSMVEACDGIDNDYNPATPDGSGEPWYGNQTTCGLGACSRIGTMICDGGVQVNTCSPGSPTGGDSNCNGIDENCDGVPDNNYVPTFTNCGTGVCSATGQLTCSNGTTSSTCTPGNPPEAHETSCSDGLDNDCDGYTDCDDADCAAQCQTVPPGDCNGDDKVDAGDISALVLEIFDGDGNLPGNAPGGTFPGDAIGSDANGDGLIDAGDISCLVLIIFNGPGACGN